MTERPRKDPHDRDPFRIPVLVEGAVRTWGLWAFITDGGLLLGFAATPEGAASISAGAGEVVEVHVREVLREVTR